MSFAAPRRSRRAEAHARSRARLEQAQISLQRELSLQWRIHALALLMVRRVTCDPHRFNGLSLVAWRVLVTLAYVPGLAANEITALWGFEKMAVNRAIRELMGRNFVVGGEDPYGGRRIPLNLSPAGHAFHEMTWPQATSDYTALANSLSPEELETLGTLMDRLLTRARHGAAS